MKYQIPLMHQNTLVKEMYKQNLPNHREVQTYIIVKNYKYITNFSFKNQNIMENFPASDFMTDFEIAEIDNEMYENNRRRLLILAEQQRQAREAEEIELNRQEGEIFLMQAAEEAQTERNDIEATIADIHNNIFVQNLVANSLSVAEAQTQRNEIEATIADIHNNIFVQNFVANTLSYKYMGVVPLLTITSPSSSSSSSSTDSDDYEYDEDKNESGLPHNSEGSGLIQNDEKSNYLDPHHHSKNHSQLQNDQTKIISTNEQTQEDIDYHTESIQNSDSENEYFMNLETEKTIIETTTSNDDSVTNSDQTFYSPGSIPANSTTSPEISITSETKSSHVQNNQDQSDTIDPILLRYNDIAFLHKINNIDKTPKNKPIFIISSVRPSFSCSKDQDYFVCHLCHSLKISITYKTNEWKKVTNEYPFVRNIASIWKHLYDAHCNIEPGENRHIHTDVRKKVLSYYNKSGFKNPTGKLLQMKTSIPKSLSMSCIRTAWKSNQTEITKEIVNTYYFPGKCGGHRRLFYTEGLAYNLDLAISMYCSCNAKLFPKEKLTRYKKPLQVQFGIQGEENEIANIHTFFNRESMSGFGVNSILQIHPTFIVPYKIDMILPKRPGKYGNITRSMTKEKLLHKEKQDNSININPVPGRNNTTKNNRKPPIVFNTEETRSPGEGLAAKLGAATNKLLTIRKKAGPSKDK